MESEIADSSSTDLRKDDPPPSLTLVRKQFAGRYAIKSEEFSNEMVWHSNHFCLSARFFLSPSLTYILLGIVLAGWC